MNAQKFLDTIFVDLADDEHVCVSRGSPKKDGSGMWFNNYLTSARQWRKWDAFKQDQAWYFCVSTIDGELNAKGSMVGRGRQNLRRYFCLVLDDIGTKADAPPVDPSWIVESSAGNFQWGYLLDPGDDWGRYEALVEYCHTKGWGDAGAGGSYRLMRVPGSANLKPGRDNFHTVLDAGEWDVWTLDELADDLGCDFSEVVVKDNTNVFKQGGAIAMDGIDPMLDWLSAGGHVVSDTGAEWLDIICPWADSHTSGANLAGYSPLGRGVGKYVQTRAFNCMHEHCQSKKLKEFRAWAVERGGPEVSGFDPLPWLQAKYTYVSTGQMVYDLHQRPIGGIWSWSLADWTKDHPGRVTMPGHERPILVANAFVEHEDTKKCVDAIYEPVARTADTGLVTAHQQQWVNTYVPPNWPETDAEPLMFLEHVEYLVPDAFEREWFLSWLAYKIQHPTSRSYACVMIAENAFGTGRSWIGRLLGKMMPGHVNKSSLPALIGKGTSAEQTYNSWMVGCQFLLVEEAKDGGMTREDFYSSYETFKQNIEPGDAMASEAMRVNDKYGRTRNERVFFNALSNTNHADAMMLEEGDRRVMCVENPTERKDHMYYDRLAAALTDGEPQRVYWWLMRRDVGSYDNIYPPMTPSKARMMADNRAPSDVVAEWIRENHPSDVVTRATLKTAIVVAARDLDDDKNMREPGLFTKMLWRKLKSLRPDDAKNGARYMIDGKQTEIRAIRNQEKWVVQDDARDTEIMKTELGRTAARQNVAHFSDYRGEKEDV